MSGIIGIVKSIIFESPDSTYKIIRIKTEENESLIVLGSFPIIELENKYRFKGEMFIDQKYGLELKASSYEVLSHDTKEGVVAYLSSGRFKGIGEKTAIKIVDALGLEAIDKIIEDYECLKKIKISTEKAKKLSEMLKESRDVESIFIKLYDYGLTQYMANKIYSLYGEETLKKIDENPYILIKDLDGYGFIKADNLALRMGYPIDSPLRLKEGIKYTLKEACIQKGYTFLTHEQLINTSYQTLTKNKEPFDISFLEDNLEALKDSNSIISVGNRFYPKYLYDAEELSRSRLLKLLDGKLKNHKKEDIEKLIPEAEKAMSIELTTLQKDAVIKALTDKVSIITGGPGTGKTTIVKAILLVEAFLNNEELDSSSFRARTILLAPTGKASHRLGSSCNMNSSTIHKALGYTGLNTFERNKFNPLDQVFIIIDESSMIDIELLSHLLDAVKDSSHIVFVGDRFQLPSVGPGNVLAEMIDSKKIPTAYLKEIMRQKSDSNIIKLSQMIFGRKIDYSIFNEKKEAFFYNADSQEVLGNIESLLKLYLSKGGTFENIQILAPMYSGPCGIDNINKMIQEKFNQSDKEIIFNNKKFKLNDKVLQLENTPELELMNGDEGYIKEIVENDDESYLYISFDGRMVKYLKANLDKLTLGYAISIHKSQGSEYENVILPIVSAFTIMLKPKLIYTAITRAKKKLIILGKPEAFSRGVNELDDTRQTSLFTEINEKKVIRINDPLIPFDTLGEENMENVSPYDFM